MALVDIYCTKENKGTTAVLKHASDLMRVNIESGSCTMLYKKHKGAIPVTTEGSLQAQNDANSSCLKQVEK